MLGGTGQAGTRPAAISSESTATQMLYCRRSTVLAKPMSRQIVPPIINTNSGQRVASFSIIYSASVTAAIAS